MAPVLVSWSSLALSPPLHPADTYGSDDNLRLLTYDPFPFAFDLPLCSPSSFPQPFSWDHLAIRPISRYGSIARLSQPLSICSKPSNTILFLVLRMGLPTTNYPAPVPGVWPLPLIPWSTFQELFVFLGQPQPTVPFGANLGASTPSLRSSARWFDVSLLSRAR